MVPHMKTTVELSDVLLREVRKLAAREGTTVRALVEQGLRRVLAERKQVGAFQLRKATFAGTGLQPGVKDTSWEQIRDFVYEGRGG